MAMLAAALPHLQWQAEDMSVYTVWNSEVLFGCNCKVRKYKAQCQWPTHG